MEDVTRSPSMGAYLTYENNQKEDPVKGTHPDQNYARELMQLFTLGVAQLNQDGTSKNDSNGKPLPTYGPSDISGLAAVFTGLVNYQDSGNGVDTDLQPMQWMAEQPLDFGQDLSWRHHSGERHSGLRRRSEDRRSIRSSIIRTPRHLSPAD